MNGNDNDRSSSTQEPLLQKRFSRVKPTIYLPSSVPEDFMVISLPRPSNRKSNGRQSNNMKTTGATADELMQMSGSLLMTYEKQREAIKENKERLKTLNSVPSEGIFVIRIEDVISRIGYENLLARMRSNKKVKKLVVLRLKNRFLSQQCKEIELCSRHWPSLQSVKIEGTSLEEEHAKTFARMFLNKSKEIKSIVLNSNGMNEETFYQLFIKRGVIESMPNLERVSIRSNPNVRYSFLEKMQGARASKNLRIEYEPEANNRGFQFISLNLSDCSLDDEYIGIFSGTLNGTYSAYEVSSLDLSNNPNISEKGWATFSTRYLSSTFSLRDLVIRKCNIDEKQISRMAESIEMNPYLALRFLDLSYNNNIGVGGWRLLSSKILASHSSLEKFFAIKCGFTDVISSAIEEGLGNPEKIDSKLAEADFSENWNLTEKGWNSLISAFAKRFINFKRFIVNDCVLNEPKLKRLCEHAADNMSSLNISKNSTITESGWREFCNVFISKSEALFELNLKGCGLNSSKLELILNSLKIKKFNACLRDLDLSGNIKLLPNDWKKLALTFPRLTALEKLSLSECGLNEDSVAALCDGILECGENKEKLPNLKSFILSKNPDIRENSWAYLLENFFACFQLEEISIAACRLSPKAIALWVQAIDNSKASKLKIYDSLRNFDLSDNEGLDLESWNEIFRIFVELATDETTSNFKELVLTGCSLDSAKLESIAEKIDSSKKNIFWESIDLSRNSAIHCKSWEKFFEVLFKWCPNLTKLSLRTCLFDMQKISTMAEKLSIYRSGPQDIIMKSLDLGGNGHLQEISKKSLFEIANYCEEISFADCNLKGDTIADLALVFDELKLNPSKLNLQGLKFPDIVSFQKFMESLLQKKSSQAEPSKNEQIRIIDETSLNDLKFKEVCSLLVTESSKLLLTNLNLSGNKEISERIWAEFSSKIFLFSQDIKTVNLSNCDLTDAKINAIFNIFSKENSSSNPPSIKKLKISNNPEITEMGWGFFAKIVLNDQSELEELFLDCCNLEDKKILLLASCLKREATFNFKKLSFAGNPLINERGWREICIRIINRSPELEFLDLADNNFDDTSLQTLFQTLRFHKNLKSINFSKNSKQTERVFNEVAGVLSRGFQNLEAIDFNSCGLNDSKILAVCHGLENRTGKKPIASLNFSDNSGITKVCWGVLLNTVFSAHHQLLILKLSKCGLNDENLQKIILNIDGRTNRRNTLALKFLDLSDNFDITDLGFFDLFYKLPEIFPELETIGMANMFLNDNKIAKISEASVKAKSKLNLKEVILDKNKHINENGWKNLFEIFFFKYAENLKRLSLFDCDIKSSHMRVIADSMHKANLIGSIERINLGKNWGITDSAWKNFAKIVYFSEISATKCIMLQESAFNDNKVKALGEALTESIQSKRSSRFSFKGAKNTNLYPDITEFIFDENKSLTEIGWKELGNKIFCNLPKLKKVSLRDCDLDCDAKIIKLFSDLMMLHSDRNDIGSFKAKNLKRLSVSLHSLTLHDGLLLLHNIVYGLRLEKIKIRFNTEEQFLKTFWNPLNFTDILKTFYTSNTIDHRRMIFDEVDNPGTRQREDISKFSLDTLVLEPRFLLPFIFDNPGLKTYEDIILNDKIASFLDVYQNFTSLRNVILINYSSINCDSLLSKETIIETYNKFKDTVIEKIYIDYKFNHAEFNLTETEMIDFVLFLPPKIFKINEGLESLNTSGRRTKVLTQTDIDRINSGVLVSKKKLSLNALKALYTIFYEDINLTDVKIDYDYDSVLNKGIAFSLREKVYKWRRKNAAFRLCKFLCYKFLSIFIKEPQYYRFSNDAIQLNYYLSRANCLYIMIYLLALCYYGLSIFLPIYFIREACGRGLSWTSHIIYAIFMILSTVLELGIYRFFYSRISKIYLSFYDYALSAEKRTFGNNCKRKFWLMVNFVVSMVSRYDLYSDIAFIMIAFQCGRSGLAYAAVICIALNMVLSLMHFWHVLKNYINMRGAKANGRRLNTHYINIFIDLFYLTEFVAVGNILENIAPYYVKIIPDNFITRKFWPELIGQSINAKIFTFFTRFIVEDTPQLIMQSYYLLTRTAHGNTGGSDWMVILALAVSFMNFLLAFYKFMSLRPSALNQVDFDELVAKKLRYRSYNIKSLLDKRDSVLEKYAEQVNMKRDQNIIDRSDEV